MYNKEEIIITANNYMESLIPGMESISEKFINGEKEALNNLSDGIEGIQYITKVITLVEFKVEVIEKLNLHLNEIISAIENEDYILVGDLIKYELIPILLEVKGMFKLVIRN